jgi:hypothetical protein
MSDRDELRTLLNRLYLEGGRGWIERAVERLTIITDRLEARSVEAEKTLREIMRSDPPCSWGELAERRQAIASAFLAEQEKGKPGGRDYDDGMMTDDEKLLMKALRRYFDNKYFNDEQILDLCRQMLKSFKAEQEKL